jgi:hypothetical protein
MATTSEGSGPFHPGIRKVNTKLLEVVVSSFVKMDKGTFDQFDPVLVAIIGAYNFRLEIGT